MNRYKILAAVTLFGFCSCSCAGNKVLTSVEEAPIELAFLPPTSADKSGERLTADFTPTQMEALDEDAEFAIASRCGMPYSTAQFLPELGATILTYAVGKVADYIVDRGKKEVQKKLDKYVAQYANEAKEQMLYQSAGTGDTPVLAVNCLRFSRTADKELTVDLIAAVSTDGHSLIIEPLRLFVGQTSAESEDKSKQRKVDVRVQLKARAIWADDGRGYDEIVVDSRILNETVRIDEERRVLAVGEDAGQVKYYFTIDGEKMVTASKTRLPLIPWSSGIKEGEANGLAYFTATVTETGLEAISMRLLAEFLEESTDYFTKLLKDSVLGTSNK